MHCRITVKGKVDPSWSEWFGGMALGSCADVHGAPVTTLTGVIADQAALRGILTRLWDLNLTVISVESIDPAVRTNPLGHNC